MSLAVAGVEVRRSDNGRMDDDDARNDFLDSSISLEWLDDRADVW
jgi:hypothetical protein